MSEIVDPHKVTPKVKGLNCPGCGSALTIRSLGRAVSVVCPSCLRVLDALDPNLKILSEFEGGQRVIPVIPLGKRGKFPSGEFECIGFQERQSIVDDTAYSWQEYLLFNPYKGYIYLTCYANHWNEVKAIALLPKEHNANSKPGVVLNGQQYAHFQAANAQTTYVFGEFPWLVRQGETVRSNDYIAPPLMLSSEHYGGEITWSQGVYRPASYISAAFGLELPEAHGTVFANQPNPSQGKPSRAWLWFLAASIAMMLIAIVLLGSTGKEKVFDQVFSIDHGQQGDKAFVTDTFEIKKPGTLSVQMKADVENDEAFLGITLINEQTGHGWEFSKSLSHYSGRDEDGSWSEGSRSASITLSGVPAGMYYFRVEPDMDEKEDGTPRLSSTHYELSATRGGLSMIVFWIALSLLIIPPIGYSIQKANFETRRWLESDYAPASGSDSSSGDDD